MLVGRRIPPFDSGVIARIAEREWLGNVKQLRTVVLTTALDVFHGDERPIDTIVAERYAASVDDYDLNALRAPLDPLAAAAILEANGFHERRAAARLGCTLGQLRNVISPRRLDRETP